MKKYNLGTKWKRGNQRKRTPIPLLALQMSVFNTYPTKEHKDALSMLRAHFADRVYANSFKVRERL